MKPAEARIVLDTLIAGWPHTDMPPDTARIWLRVLSDLDYRVATAAAETIVKNDQYFPSIARLRKAVASTDHENRFQWAASPSCPVCEGSNVVTDEAGQWWLCRCAVMERRPTPITERNKPPQALLDAARQALRKDTP